MKPDIVIVGGGPAGLSFACSVAKAINKLHVVLLERQSLPSLSDPAFDGRDIALTHLSVRILKQLGVWARLPVDSVSPIKEAKVLNGNSPYSLNFDARGESLDALGYLVSNHHIRKALFDEAQNIDNLEILADTVVTSVTTSETNGSVVVADERNFEASLVVAADSRFSETRRMLGIPALMQDFGRACIVCRMEHDDPHDGVAFECFHYGRTLAILPLNGNQSSIVITAPMTEQHSIVEMSQARFNLDVQMRFESRLGEMRLVTERFAYPLVGVHAQKFFATRFALIGDAAVGMHPVTAHGFNLGLSGQEILAKEVIKAVREGTDIGDSRLLKRFERMHMRTTRPIYHGTNEIVRMFTDDRLPAKLLRNLTLRMVNNFPPIKQVIRHKLIESRNHNSILSPLFGQL
ncbi:MAG: 5-demethoxyubiquinol-8 5-hydroxylase UbiM [Proteobacteria bacterium]|nr:5-demethoxyubiquinol-8 5-hydroxylase UbiM [Pseudomonadota bacterium]